MNNGNVIGANKNKHNPSSLVDMDGLCIVNTMKDDAIYIIMYAITKYIIVPVVILIVILIVAEIRTWFILFFSKTFVITIE